MKAFKMKEPVRLRMKSLANGNQSLYLDIYKNGHRTYEFLKLYLIQGETAEIKAQNENTLRAAYAIKAERNLEVANSIAGISNVIHRSKTTLLELLDMYMQYHLKQGASYSRRHTIAGANHHIRTFAKKYLRNPKILLKDIDADFCTGYVEYLKKKATVNHEKSTKKLTVNTQASYYDHLVTVLNFAINNDLLDKNPASRIPSRLRPHGERYTRGFLVIDEIKRLIKTPCYREEQKRMFLFSCFTGLRASDVCDLRWGDIHKSDEGYLVIERKMIKTKENIVIPLSKPALNFLPNMPNDAQPKDYVYSIRCLKNMTKNLLRWAEAAGIENKRVTFHVARHTFATLELTQGADIYTVSKLLGHANIETTQIYAKVIDKKKAQAISLLDNVL